MKRRNACSRIAIHRGWSQYDLQPPKTVGEPPTTSAYAQPGSGGPKAVEQAARYCFQCSSMAIISKTPNHIMAVLWRAMPKMSRLPSEAVWKKFPSTINYSRWQDAFTRIQSALVFLANAILAISFKVITGGSKKKRGYLCRRLQLHRRNQIGCLNLLNSCTGVLRSNWFESVIFAPCSWTRSEPLCVNPNWTNKKLVWHLGNKLSSSCTKLTL